MKVIAGIECRQEALGMLRVTGDLIEVDDRIEVSGSSDPFIHGLAVCFAGRAGMIEVRSDEGRERCADDCDVMSVSADDHLLVRRYNLLNHRLVIGGRDVAAVCQHTDVVDSFEYDQVAGSRLRDNIEIEARQCIRPQAIVQQTVPSDPLIENA
jgi:hypothetical protein